LFFFSGKRGDPGPKESAPSHEPAFSPLAGSKLKGGNVRGELAASNGGGAAKKTAPAGPALKGGPPGQPCGGKGGGTRRRVETRGMIHNKGVLWCMIVGPSVCNLACAMPFAAGGGEKFNQTNILSSRGGLFMPPRMVGRGGAPRASPAFPGAPRFPPADCVCLHFIWMGTKLKKTSFPFWLKHRGPGRRRRQF